ncbi:hypothetical protein VOLCADRAFT_87233 [Volvox carteri f. nagariensis]|uniref:Uncharacterized protein n=1 Tax=Volvox carteri f. nagariensis TaxID=3068 RepID=D8TKI3_VOLCA|nr:uncharacterized protein VOLCADRAFT_87233 [Volvox carteri f. nagariensis]EFJ52069.1 hypothetical protein VOLCADRAFT_87233 [Volvox carteri f. nagariensis]|eukprot:XP_002946843.1 hypothetical protein VOLCADRAFT_87233 [Volvox carteri f. nagariensis]
MLAWQFQTPELPSGSDKYICFTAYDRCVDAKVHLRGTLEGGEWGYFVSRPFCKAFTCVAELKSVLCPVPLHVWDACISHRHSWVNPPSNALSRMMTMTSSGNGAQGTGSATRRKRTATLHSSCTEIVWGMGAVRECTVQCHSHNLPVQSAQGVPLQCSSCSGIPMCGKITMPPMPPRQFDNIRDVYMEGDVGFVGVEKLLGKVKHGQLQLPPEQTCSSAAQQAYRNISTVQHFHLHLNSYCNGYFLCITAPPGVFQIDTMHLPHDGMSSVVFTLVIMHILPRYAFVYLMHTKVNDSVMDAFRKFVRELHDFPIFHAHLANDGAKDEWPRYFSLDGDRAVYIGGVEGKSWGLVGMVTQALEWSDRGLGRASQ